MYYTTTQFYFSNHKVSLPQLNANNEDLIHQTL